MEVISYNKSCSMATYFRNRYKLEKLLKVLGIYSFTSEVEDFTRLTHQGETSLCKTLVESLKEGDILLVPALSQLSKNPQEVLGIIKDISDKKARLVSMSFDSKMFKSEWDFLMLEDLLTFSDSNTSDVIEESETEKKSVDYPNFMFDIACEYLASNSVARILRRYKLGLCNVTMRRLCEEYIGDEFKELKGFGTCSEKFKAKVLEVVKS